MRKLLIAGLIGSMVGWCGAVTAATVVVTDLNLQGWTSTGNSGGGSSAITATHPRSGNGSVELHGDRTRWYLDFSANSVLLSSVSAFGFEWGVDLLSSSNLGPDYTPALRLHIYDAGTSKFSELIWEGAYNGVYGSLTKGVWNTTDVYNQTVWRWVTGSGVTLNGGGAQVNQSISTWGNTGNGWYTDQAYVYGISVGAGSSVGAGYHAFADNIVFGTGTSGESTTYNFETQEIPEPATVALLSGGAMALARLRRRNLL